jgi:hypothetical protein
LKDPNATPNPVTMMRATAGAWAILGTARPVFSQDARHPFWQRGKSQRAQADIVIIGE